MGDGGAAYNRAMLHSLHDMLAPAVAERLTLVINHVLGGEPVATERLRPHAGRTLALTLAGWPRLLPPPPALAWRVTPAGLLDWCGLHGVDGPDLAVQVDASNPALLLAPLLGGVKEGWCAYVFIPIHVPRTDRYRLGFGGLLNLRGGFCSFHSLDCLGSLCCLDGLLVAGSEEQHKNDQQ